MTGPPRDRLAAWRGALIDAPAAADALRGLAEAAGDGNRITARTWWRRLLAVAPDDIEGLGRLIAAHLADGHRREARPLLAMLVDRMPGHAKTHLLAERGFGPYDRGAARRSLRRALILQPDLLDALARLAHHAYADGETDTSIRLDRRLVRFRPEAASAHQRLGHAFHDGGAAEAAAAHFRRAVELDPELPAAMRRAIDTHLSRGDVAEARHRAMELTLAAPGDGVAARLVAMLDRIIAAIEREAASARDRLNAAVAAPSVVRGRRRISVTIPSLRPELLCETLAALAFAARDAEVEAVVVSGFPVGPQTGLHVVWVPEVTRQGSNKAHVSAFERATGDVLLNLADDRYPLPGALDVALEQLDACDAGGAPCSVGLNPAFGSEHSFVGTSFGCYYPYFGLLTRRSVTRVGAYFDPGYQAGFGDSDMGLRIWAAGGRCEHALAAPIVRHPLAGALRRYRLRSSTIDADRARYDARWWPIFGRRWGPAMEDYHIDYAVSALRDGTICGMRPPRHR